MSNPLKLLLIEDSPNDSELLVHYLKKASVETNVERIETLSALKACLTDTEWDFIICDYNLPQFNALQALRVVKETSPDTPCIIVSGTSGEELAVETIKAGASDYILKGNFARLIPVMQRELKELSHKRERRVIEENLKKTEENLRQAQKLESIGRLAGGIAHDFNNLLATILIQSEVLLEGLDRVKALPVIDDVERGIVQIIKSCKRATNLTRQLLAFSRKQVLQSKIINLNSLVIDMEEMLRRVIEENIEFKINLAPDLKNINIDPGHIEQILMNLVVNSRDSMPHGGRLEIETQNSQIDDVTAKTCNVQPGRHVLLRISDTGSGMSDEVKKHLFEPFFTTKAVGKGTGLGLCTIYGIVKQNKGLIFVESEENKGTRFNIYFPITDEELVPPKPPNKEPTVRGGNETLLVVEDEEDLRDLICEMLRSNHYNVIAASNGQDALEQIKNQNAKIDLVISDVIMPQMGGPELAKHLKMKDKSTRFLFQSGYTKEALIENGLDEDKIFFLAKPYPLKMLLSQIRVILN